MQSGDQRPVRRGPFTGLNENPQRIEADSQVLDCLNVRFWNGEIARRPGFAPVGYPLGVARVRLNDFRRYDGASDFPANELRSFDQATTALVDVFSTALRRLYVGLAHRDPRLYVSVSVANAIASVLQVGYWNGNGFTDAAADGLGLVDGTSVAGKTMAQSGAVTFTEPTRGKWVRGGIGGSGATMLDPDMYWLQLLVTVGLTAGQGLAGIYGLSPTSYFVRGLHGFDAPGRGPRLLIETWDRDYLESRYFAWSDMGDWLEAVALRDSARDYGEDAAGPAVSFAGHLVIPAPSGRALFWNGTEAFARRVEALQGQDARDNVDGQETYLRAAPLGLYVENWQDRLVLANDPKLDPLQFAISVANAAFALVPADAALGGGSLWRLRDVYHVPSRDGDRIQGICALGGVLALPTLDDLWTFDLSSLRPMNAAAGCVAGRTVRKAGDAVFYLGNRALYAFDGGNLRRVDAAGELQRTWDLVAWQSVETDAFAVVDPLAKEYRLFLPVRGEIRDSGARLVVIVSTSNGSLAKDAAAPVFEDLGYHGASPLPFENGSGVFTAAGIHRIAAADRRCIVADTSGRLYYYGVETRDGESTGPNPFAYVVFPEMGASGRLQFRDLELLCLQDGSPVEIHELRDGQPIEQFIVSSLAGSPKGSAQAKAADGSGGQIGSPLPPWTAAAWGADPQQPFYDRLKFSFREKARRVRHLLWLPGGTRAGPSGATFSAPTDARGGIRALVGHVGVEPGEGA